MDFFLFKKTNKKNKQPKILWICCKGHYAAETQWSGMLAEVDCTKRKICICRHKNDFFMQHVTTAWAVQTRLSTTVHVELKIDMLGCKLENDCSQPHTVHASTSVWTHPVCACSSWSCLTARTPGKGSTWRPSCTVSMENYWDSERTSANRSTISSSGTCCSFFFYQPNTQEHL